MAREDNNLFVKPPFGDAQIIRWQGIELVLDQCSFNPDGGIGPIGYTRFQNSATLAKINQYTIFGSNPISSPLFTEKFAFEWSLILDQDDWYKLEAILRGQQRNIQTRQAASAIQIELLDARKLLIEPTARDRAQCSEAPATAEASVPSGFDIFYPKFYVLLSVSQDQINWLLDPDQVTTFVEFRMVGLELDKVPTSEDENIKLIP